MNVRGSGALRPAFDRVRHSALHRPFEHGEYDGIYAALILGQSNAVGVGLVSGLTDASYATAYPAVHYVAQIDGNTDPPVLTTYDGDLDDVFFSAAQRMGIELSLGRDLDHSMPDRWVILKSALSSTSLSGNHDPNGTYPTAQPNWFTQCVTFARAQLAALNARLGVVIWIQGENDGGALGTANAYDDNLLEYVDALRAALGEVPFLYGRLNAAADVLYKTELRASQANCNGARTDLIMVDMDAVALDATDNVHYTADGYVALGHIYASAALAAMGINALPTAGFTTVENVLDVAFTSTSTDSDGTIASYHWDFDDGASSTLQNPSHTFASAGDYDVTLTVTDNDGGQHSTTQTVSVDGANWTLDATSAKAVLQNNTEWQALIDAAGEDANANPPTSNYLCDDAAAPAADANGFLNLPFGGAGESYQQAVAGWTKKALKLTDGTNAGWFSASATLPDISTTAVSVFFRIKLQAAAPAATRNIIVLGTTTIVTVRLTSAGKLSVTCGANVANGTANPLGLELGCWLTVNPAGNVVLITPQETLTVAFAGGTGKTFRIGSQGAATGTSYLQVCRFDGVAMLTATCKALSTEMGDVMA